MSGAGLAGSSSNLLAIAGMAAATLACRIGGYALFARITPGRFARRMLAHVPGTIFTAFVFPALVRGGTQDWIGAAATIGAMLLFRNLGLAITIGVAAVWGWHALA
jgi:uncharacterized membrane protein